MLADRGAQDYFTLLVFDHMRKNGIPYEVLFSNHDATFMSAYENGLLKTPEKDNHSLGPETAASLANLSILYNNNIIDESEIQYLVEKNHKPNLKLISYDVYRDGKGEKNITFYTHAPVDFEAIQDMAVFLDVLYQDKTIEEFCNTLDQINKQFSLKLALGEINEAMQTQHNLLRKLDLAMENNNELPYLNGIIIKHQTPLITFSWSRVKEVSDSDLKPKKEPRSTYFWPTTGWRAKAINCHGHASGHGTVMKKGSNRGSNHFINTDTSNFGKNNLSPGEMIQSYSQTNRAPQKIALSDADKKKTITRLEKLLSVKKPLSQFGFDFLYENEFRDFPDGIFNAITLNEEQFTFLFNKGLRNFAGADLSKINLNTLGIVNYTNNNWSNENLVGMDLSNALINTKSTFNNMTVSQIEFDVLLKAGVRKFPGLKFDKLDLSNKDVSDCDFTDVDFTHLTVNEKSIFKGCKLNQAQFDILFSKGHKNFSGINLSEVDLSNKVLTACDFTDIIVGEKTLLKNIKLNQAQFDSLYKAGHKNFSGVDLSDLNLSNKYLSGFDFSDAKLNKTYFSKTTFIDTKFHHAEFNGTNFSNADLNACNLSNANLSTAIFIKANLRESTLENSNLCGTQFNGADLTEATLTGAAINNESNFFKCIIEDVKCSTIVTQYSHNNVIHPHEITALEFIDQYENQYRQLKNENTVSLFRSNYIKGNYYKNIATDDAKLLTILAHSKDKPKWTASKENRTATAVTNAFNQLEKIAKNRDANNLCNR